MSMAKANGKMLTTVDNPYHPVDQFQEWYNFDTSHGYHTLSLLARIAVVSDEMSEIDYKKDLEVAMEEIVEENVTGMHRIFEIEK